MVVDQGGVSPRGTYLMVFPGLDLGDLGDLMNLRGKTLGELRELRNRFPSAQGEQRAVLWSTSDASR
jgi:hypothetical protein